MSCFPQGNGEYWQSLPPHIPPEQCLMLGDQNANIVVKQIKSFTFLQGINLGREMAVLVMQQDCLSKQTHVVYHGMLGIIAEMEEWLNN